MPFAAGCQVPLPGNILTRKPLSPPAGGFFVFFFGGEGWLSCSTETSEQAEVGQE